MTGYTSTLSSLLTSVDENVSSLTPSQIAHLKASSPVITISLPNLIDRYLSSLNPPTHSKKPIEDDFFNLQGKTLVHPKRLSQTLRNVTEGNLLVVRYRKIAMRELITEGENIGDYTEKSVSCIVVGGAGKEIVVRKSPSCFRSVVLIFVSIVFTTHSNF
jgi:hypothetical protein